MKSIHAMTPTDDLSHARAELDEFGVTILAGALDRTELEEARKAIERIARHERQSGTAFLESGEGIGQAEAGPRGPNQRILGLIGKDRVFGRIACKPGPLGLIREIFGDSYGLPNEAVEDYDLADVLISSVSANIASKDGKPQAPHTDQGFAPAATSCPLLMNVIHMITDFTEVNGATLLAPGSHALDGSTFYADPPNRIAACGPAGSAIIFDGRVWHGTGANRTEEDRIGLLATYCRPFVRQFENFALTLNDDALADMDHRLLSLLGFKVWMLLGGVNGERHGEFVHERAQKRARRGP